MSPNQPKTPISSFRLSQETRANLAQIAETMGTTMTGAISNMTASVTALGAAFSEGATRYPFEAHTAALGAFREAMNYEPGQVIPRDVVDMVDRVVIAANPIIREEQHYETLRCAVADLRAMGADAKVIAHLEDQIPD